MTPLAAGRRHSVGRVVDGSVVAVGKGTVGECDVGTWRDVVAVAAGNVHTAANTGRSHTVGLRVDGTVVATGWNGDGQCEVRGWREVAGICAGWRRTLGLCVNGTVLAVGRNAERQCEVGLWREIVALGCGDWHSVGVLADGRAVAVGINRGGQCDVGGWRGLVGVAAGYLHTVAVRADGTVVAAGRGGFGECDVDDWAEIGMVAACGRTRSCPRGQHLSPVRGSALARHRCRRCWLDPYLGRPPGRHRCRDGEHHGWTVRCPGVAWRSTAGMTTSRTRGRPRQTRGDPVRARLLRPPRCPACPSSDGITTSERRAIGPSARDGQAVSQTVPGRGPTMGG